MDAELKLRMATNALLLALLQQSAGDPVVEKSFISAREALGAVPQTEVDPDRLNQLLAILDYHEAKLLASRGEETMALSQLMRATQTLNRIADQRPDAAILRSELADCYLASATILEGMGNLGDAREVRSLASAEFIKLLKADPKNFSLRLDLAGSYGAMAESAVLSGDIAGAELISREAMKLLDELVVEQPDNAEAVARKAVQLGLRAGIYRDRGLSKEAMADYDRAIRMLEEIRASAPENAMISYRLALLWWQKGRMLGMAGEREHEIGLIQKAGAVLRQLETHTSSDGPSAEQLQSAGAYLQGDLGHSLQLSNQKDRASEAFRDAVALWEGLLKSRPQSEEYTEGLEWCRQRLKDLN
jgi:tetratricopeptide (TPR) repeat protein